MKDQYTIVDIDMVTTAQFKETILFPFVRFVLVLVFSLCVTVKAMSAHIALVDDGVGHALLFNHKGNCYAVLPSHVALQNRFALTAALQTAFGSGQVFVRDTAGDIAIAAVEGEISKICTGSFTNLNQNLTDLLLRKHQTVIERLGVSAKLYDRTDAIIVSNTEHHITVKTTNKLALGTVQQGSSGSVLKLGDRILGIALKAPTQESAVFLRMDIISRWISQIFAGNYEPPRNQLSSRSDGNKGFRITGWQSGGEQTARSIRNLERGLLSDPYIVPWKGQPISFEITLSPDKLVPFSGLTMVTDTTGEPSQTGPKSVHLEVDAGSKEKPYWRSLGNRDMTATGRLNFSTGGIFARRIRVTIQTVWRKNALLRLDGLTVQ